MPNQYVKKVKLSDGTTLIDITDSTATENDVASGRYFYLATGERVCGSAVEKFIYQDSSGYICISDTLPDISALTILAVIPRAELALDTLVDSNSDSMIDADSNQIITVTRT